jgi:hypothetical protein
MELFSRKAFDEQATREDSGPKVRKRMLKEGCAARSTLSGLGGIIFGWAAAGPIVEQGIVSTLDGPTVAPQKHFPHIFWRLIRGPRLFGSQNNFLQGDFPNYHLDNLHPVGVRRGRFLMTQW